MPFKAYEKPKLPYWIASFNKCLSFFFVLRLPPCSKNLKTSLSSKMHYEKQVDTNLICIIYHECITWVLLESASDTIFKGHSAALSGKFYTFSLEKKSIDLIELISENLIMDTVYSRLLHFLKQFLGQEWSNVQVPLKLKYLSI